MKARTERGGGAGWKCAQLAETEETNYKEKTKRRALETKKARVKDKNELKTTDVVF